LSKKVEKHVSEFDILAEFGQIKLLKCACIPCTPTSNTTGNNIL